VPTRRDLARTALGIIFSTAIVTTLFRVVAPCGRDGYFSDVPHRV
jgi:hypothetical protein